MGLDQKQMYWSSQLFMAAGKAGLGFDFKRFVSEASYADEVLAYLAEAAKDPALQTLVANTQQALGSAPAAQPAPLAEPASQTAAIDVPTVDARYVGRLR
jgi:hypothetical protein